MNKSLAVLSLLSFLLISATFATAQLGEVAGQPHFNVSIGSSNTLNMVVINEASYPLPVRVILPELKSTDANAITPIMTASPMTMTIPPNSQYQINLTVQMPGGTNKPGYSWSGILQVVTVPPPSNSTSATGASIIEGVAKIISIQATKTTFNIFDYLIPAAIVIVIVAAIFAAYKKGMFARKPKQKGRAMSAGTRTKGRARRKASRKGKKPARRGKGSRKQAKGRRRRRR